MATSNQSSKHSGRTDEPKQYIQGWVEFYKLRFKVTPDVLIPRPETELLVDEVLKWVQDSWFIVHGKKPVDKPRTNNQLTILDIGTGSGNIAISIAKNLPRAKIFATDISEETLEVARENAKLNTVEDRIFFIQSNLLSSFRHSGEVQNPDEDSGVADAPQNDNLIIVTNLPYIPSSRINYLDPSVKDFEPLVALDGGSDGFNLYRKLFQQISQLRMHNPGLDLNTQTGIGKLKLIVCEIDYTHGELAISEAQKYFPEAQIEVKTDLSKKQRILLIRF